MFFCIGENENTAERIGRGDTVADAIRDWAYNTYWNEIEAEFNHYAPTIVDGKIINVRLEVPEPVPIIAVFD